MQCAYISIFRFVRQNAHIVNSSKTVQVKVLKDQYIDGLISELKLPSERPKIKRWFNPCRVYRRGHQPLYRLQTLKRPAIKEYFCHWQTITTP